MTPVFTDTLLAIAMTAADRWPLINALPELDRAKIRESLRRLRVGQLSPRVTSEGIPGESEKAAECIPLIPRDAAGTLYRGQFRGHRGNPTFRHVLASPAIPELNRPAVVECPWVKELWPLTSTGNVILCSCGVTEAIDGPIAATVNGALWGWLAAQEAKDDERRDKKLQLAWGLMSSKEKRNFIRDRKRRGVAIPPWMKPKSPEPIPVPESWQSLKSKILK